MKDRNVFSILVFVMSVWSIFFMTIVVHKKDNKVKQLQKELTQLKEENEKLKILPSNTTFPLDGEGEVLI